MNTPKPCGFCGGKPNVQPQVFSVGPVLTQVRCACGVTSPIAYTEDMAVTMWNRMCVSKEHIADELRARQEADRGRDF